MTLEWKREELLTTVVTQGVLEDIRKGHHFPYRIYCISKSNSVRCVEGSIVSLTIPRFARLRCSGGNRTPPKTVE